MRSMRAIGLVLVPLAVVGACNMPSGESSKQNASPTAKTNVAAKDKTTATVAGQPKTAGAATTTKAPVVKPVVNIDNGGFAKKTLHQEQEPSKLEPKEKFVRIIPLKGHKAPANATYVYRVKARSLQADVADMRLQAVWLPEGGWDAKDAAGESLAQVDFIRVKPVAGKADTFDLQLTRPASAVELRVFVHNEGAGTIAVNGLSVIEARPKAKPVRTVKRKTNG